jgi:cellulose synthase/poly-beta-1,6-N-acetylglucosamine synthase-like glycosyltransferase
MKISVVVPAYNEEKLLGACLESVRAAFDGAAAPGLEHEVIVCDNNSTDATPRIAAAGGAKVVFEPVNQISRSRNAGAAIASGDWLLFIDADSRLSAGTLRQLLAAVGGGRVCGGGAKVELEDLPDLFGRLTVRAWNLVSVVFNLAAGSFLFCRADTFRDTGGFSAALYAAEEIDLSRKLKSWGRKKGLGFIILPGPHVSSGRKLRLYKKTEFLRVLLLLILKPWRALRDPVILKYLYDGRR